MSLNSLKIWAELYRNTEQDDDQGGGTPQFSKLADLKVGIKPMKGIRAMHYGQLITGYPYEVTMRKQEKYGGEAVVFNEGFKLRVKDYTTGQYKDIILHSIIQDDPRDRYYIILGYVKGQTAISE